MEDIKVKVKDEVYGLEEAALYLFAKIKELYEYERETLKALAVLIRSKIARNIRNLEGCKEDLSLNKGEFDKLDDKLKNKLIEAIKETAGIIAKYNGRIVDLYYTKNCSGATANSEDVLGYHIGYLRRVFCDLCRAKKDEVEVEVKRIMELFNLSSSSYKEKVEGLIEEVERDDMGRIKKLKFMNKDLSGKDFVEGLNLKSNRLYFLQKSIGVKEIGEGLGLGVCLDGADAMAKMGKNYEDILKYYYTGIELFKLNKDYILNNFNDKKILIDPGHGGDDTGNISDIAEKDINLKVSLYLKEYLEKKSCSVVMTRDKDEYLSLQKRVDIINKERPNFFISIHMNHFYNDTVNGSEAYCYKDDEEAIELSNLILKNLNKDLNLKNRGVRVGDYFILRESKVSGIILECLYMTGREDRAILNEEGYKKIGDCIYKALCEFYGINF
ncbi:N-acetylmuramoyl-L-alanine amidase [Caloramator australicus]|uniref:N-acetylmuramoyl-L-alanine amidase n=1 Tax=Caloramator australicus RC3 TaxID=857293 RepID=I7LGB1_9CLOT|nr:N-acetylmuramoyl-L-alanine amidase [Caloramator australicus]CCJ33165.1 N-acetylmuramoyl-L-alanine amidase [Caloramator australicus RC3]